MISLPLLKQRARPGRPTALEQTQVCPSWPWHALTLRCFRSTVSTAYMRCLSHVLASALHSARARTLSCTRRLHCASWPVLPTGASCSMVQAGSASLTLYCSGLYTTSGSGKLGALDVSRRGRTSPPARIQSARIPHSVVCAFSRLRIQDDADLCPVSPPTPLSRNTVRPRTARDKES